MSENKQFDELTFWQLLAKTSVEIPIIQRDYAQGRENQQKIRDKFLKALYEALTENPVELDFVYGSKENGILQPLDGQQRLTTLFLLHWYVATKESKLDESAKIQLAKFTYETRTSSREFCKELVEKGIIYGQLLEVDKEKNITEENRFSKTIKNTAWFVATWEKDPTISAMLRMLDAIHAKFKSDIADLWEKLTDEQAISFLYVKLENFGLSDDLYIKMNARGKQLTPFENFKSQFEKHIEINKFEKNITNSEEQFAHKIDTVWTDLFWKYRGDDGLIDNELINFLAGVAISYYAEKYDSSQKEEVKNRMQFLANPPKDEKGKPSLPDIAPEDFSTKGAFQYLVDCLKVYENNHKAKTNTTPLWSYCDKTLFEDLINVSDATQQRRVLFYAQTEYLLKNQTFSQSSFNEWIRVVRNLVENAYSDNWNIDNMINLIRLVHSWSDNSNDIYSFLSTLNISKVSIAKEQVKEEIEKAKIILENQDNKQIIQATEDMNFCKGKIDFALYCIDYDIDNKPIASSFDKEKLKKIYDVFEKYLLGDDVSNDFRRAFFTIQNNDFYDYWPTSWLFAVDEPKRKIIENINDLKNYFVFRGKNNCNISKNNLAYFKELILQLSTKDIDTLISDYILTPNFANLPNWKQRIIKEKNLLDHSKKHYIAIKRDDSCCWLIPSSKVGNNENGRKQLKKIE
ncbi:MAG: DUF262 domain-containing protein [Fibrobacter sp.]|jgi:hypothetical protein|nr:DUF262 domain-containing protein [Fibrobacter sp.]